MDEFDQVERFICGLIILLLALAFILKPMWTLGFFLFLGLAWALGSMVLALWVHFRAWMRR